MSSNHRQESEWTQVIEPAGGRFELGLKDVWAYKDLIYLFVKRDFIAYYKQTILGPAWHIIQPLLTTIVFTIVFGKIAKIPTDGMPPFLFYLAGTVIWTYFASVLTDTSTTFLSNIQLFGKVYFPRLVTPVSVAISKLISFAIQLTFLIAFVIYFSISNEAVQPNLVILATPILLIFLAAFALSVGLLITAMTTRYRDLAVLVGFGVQLWMYASPVVYPLSSLPDGWRFWAALNPVAPIIETFRYAFLGVGLVDAKLLLLSACIIIGLFIFSLVIFNRACRNFADTV